MMRSGHDVDVLDSAPSDARFDGMYFVGIDSTGTYCRPICPVRRRNETDLRYFETAGDWNPVECFVRAVLGRNVTVMAARTLTGQVVARTGQPMANPANGLTHIFPSPSALAEENLQGIGLTESLAATLRSFARAVAAGMVDFAAAPEDVIETLAGLSGIGWTADYVALRALGEPNAFPAWDSALRRVADGTRGRLEWGIWDARSDVWRPWRGYGAFHLWRAADMSIA